MTVPRVPPTDEELREWRRDMEAGGVISNGDALRLIAEVERLRPLLPSWEHPQAAYLRIKAQTERDRRAASEES